MTTVLHVVGARPNFMKVAPVIQELDGAPGVRQVLVHTGQHYDPEMSQIFLDELGMPEPDAFLAVGSGGHGQQTGRALERLEPVLERERPDAVVVAGDVNSTLAGALAAVKLGIPVAHIEAGLRSFDWEMPEEINRLLTDQISRWCFTHSRDADENLRREGIAEERIFFVGNTMIDTLVRLRGAVERSDVHERLGVEPGRYVVVTLHRPKLVDGPLLEPAIASLERLSEWLPVVYPVHPRVQARLDERPRAAGLRLVPPLGYLDFLALEARAAAAVTDSAGVQEETTFLGVPCFTVRAVTERPVTVTHGTNVVLGLDVEAVERVPELVSAIRRPEAPPEGWDGRAAERIVEILLRSLAAEPAELETASR